MKITLNWHPEKTQESSISYDKSWNNMSRIAKLDFLKDSIYELEKKYNEVFEKFDKRYKKTGKIS